MCSSDLTNRAPVSGREVTRVTCGQASASTGSIFAQLRASRLAVDCGPKCAFAPSLGFLASTRGSAFAAVLVTVGHSGHSNHSRSGIALLP